MSLEPTAGAHNSPHVNPEVTREIEEALAVADAMLMRADLRVDPTQNAIVRTRRQDRFMENKREFDQALASARECALTIVKITPVRSDAKSSLSMVAEALNSRADLKLGESVTGDILRMYDTNSLTYRSSVLTPDLSIPASPVSAGDVVQIGHQAREAMESALEAIERVTEPYRELARRVSADIIQDIVAKL